MDAFTFRSFSTLTARPEANPAALWSLQSELMSYAVELFGPRNPDKTLYQPEFDPDGPHVRHRWNFDGAYAELSDTSKSDWPCALYELAHETVHLLDPRGIAGQASVPKASFLEEALATAYSMHCCQLARLPFKPPSGNYNVAVSNAVRLGQDFFGICRRLRERCGHFSAATAEDIIAVVPNCPRDVAELLASPFPGRGY